MAKLVFLFLVSFSFPALADAVQNQTPVQSYKAPYPFTADELWEKILKVVELSEGHVTGAQVERIFGVKLRRNEQSLPYLNDSSKFLHIIRHVARRGIDWYFDLSVGEVNAQESDFTFEWGQEPGERQSGGFPPPPPGMCISADHVISGIQARGWKLVRATEAFDTQPREHTYRKGKLGALRVTFGAGDNCLLDILIVADHTADHIAQ